MVELVVTVTVEDPEPAIELGLTLAAAPAGNPLTLNTTVSLNPLTAVTVAVYAADPPRTTLCVPGVAESVKSGGGAEEEVKSFRLSKFVFQPLVVASVTTEHGVVQFVLIVAIVPAATVAWTVV